MADIIGENEQLKEENKKLKEQVEKIPDLLEEERYKERVAVLADASVEEVEEMREELEEEIHDLKEQLKEQLDEQYSFSYFRQVKELMAENEKLKEENDQLQQQVRIGKMAGASVRERVLLMNS